MATTNLDRVRRILVSADSKETAYDTAAAVDCRILVSAGVQVDHEVDIITDQDKIGGTEEASDAEVYARRIAFPFAQVRAKPHSLAFAAAYALGSVTTSALGATAYKHTFTPASAAAQPSFTMEALFKSGTQNKYSGCFFDNFSLSFSRGANRFCDLGAMVYGSGTVVAGTSTVAEISEGGLNAATAAVWLDATTYDGSTGNDLDLAVNDLTSNPTAISDEVTAFEWQFRNNFDLDSCYEIGSGEVLGNADRVARDQTVSLSRLYQDESNYTRQVGDTDLALQVKVKNAQIAAEGFYYGFNLIFPKLRIGSGGRTITEQGGRLIENLTFSVLEDASLGSVVLDVVNVQTAYAA